MPPKVNFAQAASPLRDSKRLVVPKASELQSVFAAGSAKGSASRLPSQAPIELCLDQYTAAANDYIDTMPAEPLFQFQLRHEVKPSISYEVLADWQTSTTICRSSTANPRTPQAHCIGILLQLTDPCNAGCIPYRIAFYILGTTHANVQNASSLVDGFLEFRREHDATLPADLRSPGQPTRALLVRFRRS